MSSRHDGNCQEHFSKENKSIKTKRKHIFWLVQMSLGLHTWNYRTWNISKINLHFVFNVRKRKKKNKKQKLGKRKYEEKNSNKIIII